jgi:hypothetical protein
LGNDRGLRITSILKTELLATGDVHCIWFFIPKEMARVEYNMPFNTRKY